MRSRSTEALHFFSRTKSLSTAFRRRRIGCDVDIV